MVGTSVTTGQTNTVVWGGIHIKTSPHGGATAHGWPDDGYFGKTVKSPHFFFFFFLLAKKIIRQVLVLKNNFNLFSP